MNLVIARLLAAATILVALSASAATTSAWASAGSSSWDFTSTNWIDFGTSSPVVFSNGTKVVFDDSIPNVQTNILITVTQVAPSSVEVSASSNSYWIDGKIAGNGGLTKKGNGMLVLDGSNTFSGGVKILDGILRLGSNGVSALAGQSSVLTISGGTLDISATNMPTVAKQIVNGSVFISGAGQNGRGAVVNDGDRESFQNAAGMIGFFQATVKLSNNATLGGKSRWDIWNGSLNLNGKTLTKTGSNTIYLASSTFPGGGTIVVNQGVWGFGFTISQQGGTDMVLLPGGALWTFRTALSSAINYWVDDATITEQPFSFGTSASTLSGGLIITNNAWLGNHGTNGSMQFDGPITGSGRVVKNGAGRIILGAPCNSSGGMIVSNGILLVNSSFGTGQVIVISGATLGGVGTIAGPTSSDGVVAPGADNIGTLTLVNSYAQNIGGTLSIELLSSSNWDVLAVSGTAALNGTLSVLFRTNYAPVSGSSFTVLRAGAIAGTFATTNLPTITPGLGWAVSYLLTNVTLSVTGTALTGYALWAYSITNGLAGYTDSATGDGYANLLKYATGSSATNADGLAAMAGEGSNGVFALRFNRNTNATDVSLFVEGSDAATNGAAWLGIATNQLGSWGGATNVFESGTNSPVSVSVADTVAPATNRFLRLRVTRP